MLPSHSKVELVGGPCDGMKLFFKEQPAPFLMTGDRPTTLDESYSEPRHVYQRREISPDPSFLMYDYLGFKSLDQINKERRDDSE